MNKKLFVRLLCALLSVLTLVAIVPAMAISVAAYEVDPANGYTNLRWTKGLYEKPEDYLKEMTLYYSNDTFELYCDETVGVVAYRNKLTGETLWTNPWNINEGITTEKEKEAWETATTDERKEILSQIVVKYSSGGKSDTSYTFDDAANKGQISVVPIKNGLRVEYAIGPLSPRILAPERIEQTSFEENVLNPLKEGLIAEYGQKNYSWYYKKFMSYYRFIDYVDEEKKAKKDALAKDYPILAEKNINMYMLGDDVLASETTKREIEGMIKKYTGYTLEMMDEDYDFLEFEREDNSPPLFKMALEYVIDGSGLNVTLPANGLRYDESTYKINELYVLPYMGASLGSNGGYSFIADGSGAVFELDTKVTKPLRVYGDDYALQDESDGGNMHTMNHQVMRAPVYGQVEISYTDKDGNPLTKAQYNALSQAEKDLCSESERGYLAIIEEGESLAKVEISQLPGTYRHALIKTNFITRQKDKFDGGWSSYAARRYVENYKIRYVMLTDKQYANKVSSFYECSWLGMACAYRDYLDSKNNGFERLTSADISDSNIPLYIETFGCMDTIDKVLSMPVTVSKPLTTFEDVATMYDYLCANGIKNVNFKLKGYANGGLYSDMPYDLDWESSVGGDDGFEELLEKAKADGFGLFPDFDFVYTTQPDGGSDVDMKDHAARSIFNQYTTKRSYSSTYQNFVSYFQMVMAPSTYAHFYEEMSEEYAEYGATGISLGTFGSALNSDFDEDKTSLREESKQYVMQGLEYFKKQNYDVMVDAGNAFTWSYVDHILNVSLDSSRYSAEKHAVPFMGVVLHGYKQFASTPLNMEGNLSYAMLKAMESGASAYFILSYANTELLKEDEILSQNYSVRYDIWQERLVEIYHLLNSVLSDVQTKLIVKHEVLNQNAATNTIRVADQDEILKDIEEIAQNKKTEVEQKIEAERLAMLTAVRKGREQAQNAVIALPLRISNVQNAIDKMMAQLNAWKDAVAAEPVAVLAETNAIAAEADAILLRDAKIAAEATAIELEEAAIEAEKNASESDKPAATAAREAATAARIAATAEKEAAVSAAATATAEKEAATAAKVSAQAKVVSTLQALKTEAVAQSVNVEKELRLAAGDILAARAGYDFMIANNVTKQVSDEALANLDSAVKSYAALLSVYTGVAYTDDGWTEEWLALSGEPTIQSLQQIICDGGALSLKAYADVKAEATAIAAEMDVALADELAKLSAVPTYTAIVPTPVVVEGTQNDTVAVNKYKVDNNVVAVTYGNDDGTAYKTLLLNFNDYTIRTTYNGVTYTIAAYDYVQIKY